MKPIITLAFCLTLSISLHAQWTNDGNGNNTSVGDVRTGTKFIITGKGTLESAGSDLFLNSNQALKLGAGGGSSTHLTVLSTGNVGVGTTSPSSKFEVNGDIRTSTKLILTGSGTVEGSSNDISVKSNGDILFGGAGGIGQMRLTSDGRLGINVTNVNARLTVGGHIWCQEIKVLIDPNTGPDFVFDKAYNLPSLDEVEQFIEENHHLPNIEPAKEMEANGVELGKMDMKLLQKVEELTLYMIEFKKEVEQLKAENEKLKADLKELGSK